MESTKEKKSKRLDVVLFKSNIFSIRNLKKSILITYFTNTTK